MAPSTQPTLLSPSELSYLHTSLSLTPPIRLDARSPTSFRPLVAETDLLPSANGSARLCFADGTEAIVGVKGEVEKTLGAAGQDMRVNDRADDVSMGGMGVQEGGGEGEGAEGMGRGNDAWIEVAVDVPGQRDDDAMTVFLGQMIHEGLVADGALKARLWINGRWHWRLYIDILLLSPPHTYPLPLLSLTTHLALLTTHLPAPISTGDEDPLFNDDWDASLPLYPSSSTSGKGKATSKGGREKAGGSRPPITLLVVSVGTNVFFDASREELAVADGVVAATVAAPTNTTKEGLRLLAVRTIDPPSRVSSSASVLGEKTQVGEGADGAEEGVWKPRKGGMSRSVLRKMVGMCVERGGVGEEVLGGLDGFI